MAKPYDLSSKLLLEADPLAWLHYVGLPARRATLLETNVSNVGIDLDKVIRVESARRYIAHVEFVSPSERRFDRRMLRYGAVLFDLYNLPVQGVAILLRRKADGPSMRGLAGYRLGPDGRMEYAFRVIRIWEQPVESFLSGSLATVPLAPLSDVAEGDLPGIVGEMGQRIRREARPGQAAILWTATTLLNGYALSALADRATDEGSAGYEGIGDVSGDSEGRQGRWPP